MCISQLLALSLWWEPNTLQTEPIILVTGQVIDFPTERITKATARTRTEAHGVGKKSALSCADSMSRRRLLSRLQQTRQLYFQENKRYMLKFIEF